MVVRYADVDADAYAEAANADVAASYAADVDADAYAEAADDDTDADAWTNADDNDDDEEEEEEP